MSHGYILTKSGGDIGRRPAARATAERSDLFGVLAELPRPVGRVPGLWPGEGEGPDVSVSIEAGPAYVSFSAFTSWLRCGKAYQLGRLFSVEEDPAWYFVGGSAVHSVTEQYDLARWEAGAP